MYDLPSENPQQPGLPDEFHLFQPQLLRETFLPPNYPEDQVFVASDLNLYYDVHHPLWYKGVNQPVATKASTYHTAFDLDNLLGESCGDFD